MALETWLIKVKTALSHRKPLFSSSKPKRVTVLSFEIANVMSKLLHLWQSLSDANVVRLRNDVVSLEGVRKLISNDESFLLSLAVAEFADSLRLVADSVSRLSNHCHDPSLRSFRRVFTEFANSGLDPHNWILTTPKDIETRHRKMQHYVTLTATLHKEIDALTLLESAFKKALLNTDSNNNAEPHKKLHDLQQKIFWQKQEVKNLKERSLWNKNFDGVVLLLARFVFTVLARIKVVFGIGHSSVPFLSRSLSSVYPSDHQNPISSSSSSVSGPLKRSKLGEENEDLGGGFFESNCKVLKLKKGGDGDGDGDGDTLGASALALHYANLVMVLEKMIKSPQLVGVDARDDLYGMLPSSIRSSLRARLRGVGFSACDDHVLAGEWRDALGRILGWLAPLAHNMIKWQSERSYEQQNLVPKTNVLLLQTLFFANKEKTEAAITELLVGLNYVWRFEREMTAKALFECTKFNGLLTLQKPS
ncbi:phosphatidylinositol-3-phosphatase myotubularin-2 [Spatholobus suberectus]|nr:phosphatidylinositol-3-phosphatase myotubularin-2 [Spatholobus suberectus]